MRLTLRTLLAYLDDVLEPSQTKELGEKINESGFAANLMAKIKDVMRRRRLSAPALSGPGAGIDCNIVGEYLDSTLAPDKVADVEKICLESDVHLAEVAACHQVLTLVLHEPVEISPESKARLYALTPDGGAVQTQAAVAETAVPANEAPVLDRPSKVTGVKALDNPPADIPFVVPEQSLSEITSHPIAAAPTPDLPAYLREEPRNNRWMKYVVGLLIAFAWGVLMVKYGPFGGKDEGTKPSSSSADPRNIKPVEVAKDDRKEPADTAPGEDARVAVIDKKATPELDGKDEAPEKKPIVPAQEKIGIPAKVDPKTATPADDDSKKSIADAAKVAAAGTRTTEKNEKKMTTAPTGDAKPGDANPDQVATAKPVDTAKPAEVEKPETPTVTPPSAAPPVANLKAASARDNSTDAVVLHYDRGASGWLVLPPRSALLANDLLAVPEPYEGTIRVDEGIINVSVRGDSRVRMLGPTPTVNSGWEVQRGKVIFRRGTEGEQPASFLLKIQQLVWRVDLLSPDTQCAVQVDPVITDRFEQDLGERTVTAGFYVASGVVRLSRVGSGTDPAGNSEPVEIAGPASRSLFGEIPPEILGGMFRWFGPFAPSPSLKSAMTFFAKKFAGDAKVELSLTGEDNRPNVAFFEAECLGLIGAYDPLVTILQRTPYDPVRRSAIEGLRIWLPQQPGNRKLLKLALSERFTPEDADIVYELLWGYNANDLRNRVKSTSLLDWMESSPIAIRELAFQQVFRLTKKSYDYRPNSSEAQLKASVRQWRGHLHNGALLPPAPMPKD